MGDILSIILDAIMIGLLITAIAYAVKLSKQLAALRASRLDMERFVADFSSTVQRAEAGIKGLKLAAREGGDDLEKEIERAQSIRDELAFLVGSADQIANRLSDTAASAARTALPEIRPQPAAEAPKPTPQPASAKPATASPAAQPAAKKPEPAPAAKPAGPAPSNAEAELLKALEKLG